MWGRNYLFSSVSVSKSRNIAVLLILYLIFLPFQIVFAGESVKDGPHTAFSPPEILAKYTPEQRAEATKFDFNPSSLSSIASNKWLNSYEYSNRLPETTSVSGAFTYDVPIVTPPGRNGVQPSLKLQYNSQDKSNDSIFGFGWTINIPYIERINKNGLGAFYNNSNFSASMDGELATSTAASTSVYRARFDNGSMRQYTYATSTNTWTMVDKAGIQYTFGATSTARLYDPNSTSHIAVWMLEKMQDTNGNYMSYTYTQDLVGSGRQIYPSVVTYTVNSTSSAAFEVDFILGGRTLTYPSYKYGFDIETAKRVNRIDIKFNGSLVNRYVLGYTTGFNQNRDLLQSVTQTGFDESIASTTLPAVKFSYQTSNTSWATTTPLNTLPALVDSSGVDQGYRFFHWRRSQPTDAIRSAPLSKSGYEAPNWDSPGSVNNIPSLVDDSNLDIGSALVDVNGDGFPDIIQAKTGSYNDIYLWTNGGAYVSASTTMSNIPYLIDSTGNDNGVRFGDLNGDGYEDYLISTSTGAKLYLNNADGTGWTASSTVSGIPGFIDASGNDSGARLMDINGDGVDDVVKYASSDASGTAYINKGDGIHWSDVSGTIGSSIPIISGGPSGPGGNAGTSIVDIDADGLLDFVVSTPNRAVHFYINKGFGWVDRAISSIPYFLDSADAKDIGTRVIDAQVPGTNSDGIVDLVTSNASTSVDYLSTGDPVDAMTSIVIQSGGTTTVTYQGTRVDVSTLRTTRTVGSDPGLGAASTTKTFGYAYGLFQSLFQDRKFAGFARAQTTDGAGNVTYVFYHQGNGNNSSDPNELWDSVVLGEFNDIEAKMYQPYRTEQYFGNFTSTYNVATNKWDSKDNGNGRTLVFQSNSLSAAYDGLSTQRAIASAFDYATSTGNLIQKIEYGEVTPSLNGSGQDNGSFADLSNTDNRITNYSYASSSATSTNPNIVGLLSQQTLIDYLGNKISETRTYYDNLPLNIATTGNSTKQEFWKSGSSYASTTKTYNMYGLVTLSTDGRGATTTLDYDSYKLYAATSTNALGHKTGYLYNYSAGKVKKSNDPNSFIYQTTFDGLNRPIIVSEPDPSSGTLVTKTAYVYTDSATAGATSVQKTDYLNSATSSSMYTYVDGLGRDLQQRSQTETSNAFTVKDFVYDSRGLLQKETLPYFDTGSSRGSAASSSALYTTYIYDTLSRPTEIGTVVGTTSNSYVNWRVTTTDANGKLKDAYKDGFGQLVNVVEHIATTTATTTYAWDVAGNLSTTTDANSNVRGYTYDGLSRMLTSQDLHVLADTTYGTSTFSYDDAGNLTQRKNPKNQTTNFTYDALNRILTEDYTGQSGAERTYVYDTCANGKGHLCIATTTNNSLEIGSRKTYNTLGLVATDTKQIVSQTYSTRYTYDRQGNTTNILYPDSSEVFYTFGESNKPVVVKQREGTAYPWRYVVRDIKYSPLGQESQIVWGSWATTTNTYDSGHLYRLTNILTVAPPASLGAGASISGGLALLASKNYASIPQKSLVAQATLLRNAQTDFDIQDILSIDAATTSNVDDTQEAATSSVISDVPAENIEPSTTPSVLQSADTATTSDPQTVQLPEVQLVPDISEADRAKDAQVNPYVETDNSYEYSVPSQLPDGGDTKASLSKDTPEVRFEKWDGEVSLGISYQTVHATGSRKFLTNQIEWKDGTQEVHAYPVPANDEVTDGGFEIEAYLKEKPTSNVFNFAIIGAEDLNFFYQAPLNEMSHTDDPRITSCTEDQCVNSDGYIVEAYLPGVLGSYAVYHKTKANYNVGGINYGTGKLFHIYRPKAIDANSNETWAQLSYDNGKLSVTVPQDFLDKATYPVRVDPTFGYTTAGGTQENWVANDIVGYVNASSSTYTLTENGNISKLTLSVKVTSGTTNIKGLIYANGTPPGAKQGTSTNATAVTNTTQQWIDLSYASSLSLIAAAYGLSHVGDASWTSYRDNTTGQATRYFKNGSSYSSPPDPFPSDATSGSDRIGSIYATYSTSSATGSAATSTILQNISYTYDNVGNITTITDYSTTGSGKVVNYVYDDLYRLTSASTTAASSTSYYYRYSYNALGNITGLATSSATTTYTYAGTSYANPHAPTQIGATTYSYDNDGNATSIGTNTYDWDWRDHLNTSTVGGVNTTYSYDENDKRVRLDNSTTVFHYPNDLYQADSSGSGGTTKHIFLNGKDVATIRGVTGASTSTYNFVDHLGSTNVVTNGSSTVVQVLDYYPYGGIRINNKTGTADVKNKFIGRPYDDSSSLSYLQARYYDGSRGQFLSEDPTFLGNAADQDLRNPQSLNSYSYANDNPITNKDPDGRQAVPPQVIVLLLQVVAALTNYINYLSSPIGQVAISNSVQQAPTLTSPTATFGQKFGAGVSIGLSLMPEFPAGKGAGTTAKVFGKDITTGDQTLGAAGSAGKSAWPSGANGAQVIDGIKYSDHALDSMAPVGTVSAGGTAGRGIPPSVVKNAIEHGAPSSSYGDRTVYNYQNVRVVTESDGTVVTAIKTGN